MAEEGGEESLLAMIGADPKQLAEAGELDSPRNSTGWDMIPYHTYDECSW